MVLWNEALEARPTPVASVRGRHHRIGYELDGEDLAERRPPARGGSLGCGATNQIRESGGKLTQVVVHVGLER